MVFRIYFEVKISPKNTYSILLCIYERKIRKHNFLFVQNDGERNMMIKKCETNETAYLSGAGWEHGEDERIEQEIRISDNSLNIAFVKVLVVVYL